MTASSPKREPRGFSKAQLPATLLENELEFSSYFWYNTITPLQCQKWGGRGIHHYAISTGLQLLLTSWSNGLVLLYRCNYLGNHRVHWHKNSTNIPIFLYSSLTQHCTSSPEWQFLQIHNDPPVQQLAVMSFKMAILSFCTTYFPV